MLFELHDLIPVVFYQIWFPLKTNDCSARSILLLTGHLNFQVLEVIQRKPNLRKISFVAHSVGGLVARYAIGRLYRPPSKENAEESRANVCEEDHLRATIGGLEPLNFITVATPHLGSRGNKQVLYLNYCCLFRFSISINIHRAASESVR